MTTDIDFKTILNRLNLYETAITACCHALRIDADHSAEVKANPDARLTLLVRTVVRMQDHHKGHHAREQHTRDVLERLLGWFIAAGTGGFDNATDADADVGIMFIESALSDEALPIMGETGYRFQQAVSTTKRIRELEGDNALLRAKLNEMARA